MSDQRVRELSAAAKDAFDLLSGAVEIKYRDGDTWQAERQGEEHPLVHRLRSAAVEALTDGDERQITEDEATSIAGLQSQLRQERKINDRYGTFLFSLTAICQEAGMPKEARGQEVLTWVKKRLIG